MKQRKNPDERRQELSTILVDLHAKAKTQGDFTPQIVADKLGISVVWLYHMVGAEFRNLRSTLPGPRKKREAVIGQLKSENAELRNVNRELMEKLKGITQDEIAEAVIMIESLDDENRMLRSENKMLRQRLAESETMFVPNYNSYPYKLKRQSLI